MGEEMAFRDIHSFSIPTRLIFGAGSAEQLPEVLSGGRPLVVTDEGLAKAGIVERVADVLARAGIGFTIFDGVQSDPSAEVVRTGCEVFRNAGCSALIGLGGGSSMDAAKMIGVLCAQGGDILDYAEAPDRVTSEIPYMVCMPTTYGTGSEVTPFAVVTDLRSSTKRAVVGAPIAPKVAILDPELSVALPFPLAASTGLDALAHAVESYVNLLANPITEALALAAIESVGTHLREAAASDHNTDATGNMLLASTMAGMAFSQTRVGIAHALGNPLGGRLHVPHGLAIGVLLPHVMEYNLIACPEKFARIAVALGEPPGSASPMDAVWALAGDLGMPRRLREIGMTEEYIEDLAAEAMTSGSVPVNPRRVGGEELAEVLRRAL